MTEPKIKLPRQSKGKRPYFFDDPAIDQMMTFIIELSAEVSVVYDRLDTVERLLETKGTISRADVEGYRATDEVEAERVARRDGYLKRVFRMHPPVATYGKGQPKSGAKPAAKPAAKTKAKTKAKKPAVKKKAAKKKAKAKKRKR
ncbi:MAG: hypothetical protein KDE14_03845 [Rhodobacteraceae bacterium]|nr:hypothetical protein [Paracoccaceae bacterium]